jgi:four helix bundle protein
LTRYTGEFYGENLDRLHRWNWNQPGQKDRDPVTTTETAAPSNVVRAESFERGGLGEFHQFLSTAKASCAELRSQLYVALDVGYIEAQTFQELRTQSEEVGRIIGGLRVSIAKQRQNKVRRI